MTGNPKYRKGVRKELKIAKEMRENEGYNIAQRSAGSHSPVDVWCVRRSDRVITLVQSKPEGFNSKKIEEEMSWLNGTFEVRFEVR
jgi:hypothetical protein